MKLKVRKPIKKSCQRKNHCNFEKWQNIFHFLIYICLIIYASIFVKEVFIEYSNAETSVGTYHKSLDELYQPTLTICFQPFVKQSLLKSQFNLTLEQFLNNDIPNYSTLGLTWPEFYKMMSYRANTDFYLYHNGIYIDIWNKDRNDGIDIEEIYTLRSGLCYKVTNQTKTKEDEVHKFYIQFATGLYDIPSYVKIFLTSENNSYGVIESRWLEGNMYNVDLWTYQKLYYRIDLEAYEYKRLPETSKCSDKPIINCIANGY